MQKLKPLLLCIAIIIGAFLNVTGQDFSEESALRGIDHSFESFALMGGGVGVFDFNKDGYDDLYLNGGTNPDIIFINDGSGYFFSAGNSIGLEITARFNTTSIITGDTDNDGDRDLFVTTWQEYVGGQELIGRNLFFENLGDGTFQEAGQNAGFVEKAFSIGANFLDYNKDGLLDIYVNNHVEKTKLIRDETTNEIIGFDHDCYPNFLYLNQGGNSFIEIGSTIGVNNTGCTFASMATDYDLDGDLDLYLANDFGPFIVPNILYENLSPTNSFVDISSDKGAGIPMYGMGIAGGDFDHDLDLDYYITNLGKNVLLENDSGVFINTAEGAKVENEKANETELSTGWGTFFVDINNDSWEDLFVSNGRIPSLPSLPTAREDPNKLFLNNQDKTFLDVSGSLGPNVMDYGRGAAYLDLENDGDLDIVSVSLSENQGKTRIYVNQSENSNHYIRFQLQGMVSNRDGYGSLIKVYAGEDILIKELYGGGESFCSQSSSLIHFGLGDHTKVDSVSIHWLSGNTDLLYDLSVDTAIFITENQGISTAILPEKSHGIADFLIFPNPSQGAFLIKSTTEIKGQVKICILDVSGREVFAEYHDFYSNKISIKHSIPNGLYLVTINSDNNYATERLIIQR